MCIQPHVQDNDLAAPSRRNTRGLRGRDTLVQTRVATTPLLACSMEVRNLR